MLKHLKWEKKKSSEGPQTFRKLNLALKFKKLKKMITNLEIDLELSFNEYKKPKFKFLCLFELYQSPYSEISMN